MEQLLAELLERNRAFARRTKVPTAHEPRIAVVACADARVSPSHLFEASLGDLFTVRVAGNVASRSVVASLVFAVEQLGVRLVLVLGHERCGAVEAARAHFVEGGRPPDDPDLAYLLGHLEGAVTACGDADDPVAAAVAENVRATVENLGARLPAEVSVVGAVYDVDTGEVHARFGVGTE